MLTRDTLKRLDISATIILSAVAIYAVVRIMWHHFPYDLSAVYFASYFYGSGAPDLVYSAPAGFFGEMDHPAWLAQMDRYGFAPDEITFAYIYPPIWAALLGPLATQVHPTTFFDAFHIVHTLMLAAMIALWKVIGNVKTPWIVWFGLSLVLSLSSSTLLVAMFLNQPQILVSFLLVFALERYIRGQQSAAGMLLGLAAAIKIAPVLIALVFWLDGGRRAAAACLATCGGLAAASFAIAGPELHWQFLGQLQVISSQVALMNVNHNLELALFELHHLLTGGGPLAIDATGALTQGAHPEPWWVKLPVLGAFLAGLTITLCATRGLERRDQLILRFAGLWIVLTLCSPLGWNHHYIPVIMMAPVMMRFLPPLNFAVFFVLFSAAQHYATFRVLGETVAAIHAPAVLGVATYLAYLIVIWIVAARLSKRHGDFIKP